MTTATIAGTAVELNDEGFFTDPEQWTEEMAPELARDEGIDELTDRHWQVIRLHARRVPREGHRRRPSGSLGKTSGVPSRSSTSCSPRARRRSPPRSPASPSPAAASERRRHDH